MFKVERSETFGNVGIRTPADRFKVPYTKLQNLISKKSPQTYIRDMWQVQLRADFYVRDCSLSQTVALVLLHCNSPSSYIFTYRQGINVPWNDTEKLVGMEQSSNLTVM